MAHTSINVSQVKDFIGGHSAPILFNSKDQSKGKLALALATAGERPVEKIRTTIYRTKPLARIFEINAPSGKDSIKQYREFLSEVLYRLGEPPLRHGQETAAASRLSKIIASRYDFIIIDHAETMSVYSLDLFRKDHEFPVVFLVAYEDYILETLLANEALLNRIFLLG